MAKVRIFNWAKENGFKSVDVVNKLNEKGHKVRNHTSVIDEEILSSVCPKSINKTVKIEKESTVVEQGKPTQNLEDSKHVNSDKSTTINTSKVSTLDSTSKTSTSRTTTTSSATSKPYQGSSSSQSGSRPYQGNKTNQSTSRPYQGNKTGQNSSRPYQGNSTSQSGSRPYQGNSTSQSGSRPYQGNSTSQSGSRPYTPRPAGQTGSRPYQGNKTGQTGSRPYTPRPAGQNSGRPYTPRPGGQTGGRPYTPRPGGQTGGRPYTPRPGGQTGSRPYNKDKNESDLPKVEEKKPVNSRKKIGQKKKTTYDRFKMFDTNEKKNVGDAKTKTQLKKEQRDKRKEDILKESKIIKWQDDMTVSKLSNLMGIPVTDVVTKLFELGIMATINQNIDQETAEVISTEYNMEIIENDDNQEFEFENLLPDTSEVEKVKRPPIVTIMGHVDHGKTTLLDTLRKSNITSREAGGITQHIGAYQIERDGFKITFLDTPGHASFSNMRARGADITDITVLVVAADDGVMPQTKEAIVHSKEAKKDMIVCVNKMDKPGANSEKIKSELAENGVMCEEWGGDVPFIEISALKGDGIEKLIEYIKILTDLNNYSAPLKTKGYGTVIESHIDRGRGSVATIMMEGGELHTSDSIIIGDTWGSVRSMEDEYGKRHKLITASMPVEITGLKGTPESGDRFVVAEDTKQAQLIGEKRQQLKQLKDRNSAHAMSLEELNQMIEKGNLRELPVIIKGDVHGSVEALVGSLEKIDVNGVKVRVVHKGIGAINETDVNLSTTSGGILIGFNTRPDANARKLIEKEKIEVILNNVIYSIIEDIETAMMGLREKKINKEILGYAKVQEVFKISNIGKVAGCIVTEGKITREGKMRLVRDGIVIYDGEIGTLKRFKDEVKEVIDGQDCGIRFVNFEDVKKGDEFESYVESEYYEE